MGRLLRQRRALALAIIAVAGCERDAPPAAIVPADAAASPPPAAAASASAPASNPGTALPPGLQPIAILIERGALPEAREALAAYRRGRPDDPHGIFLEGLVAHRGRRYAEAEPRFVEALRLDPGYAAVQHFLGWCRFHLGDMAGARAAFEAHLAADPGESDSVFGLGLVDLEEGDLDGAEARFRGAIAVIETLAETDPARYAARRRDLGKCHARLGDVAFARGEYPAAQTLLEQALVEDPRQYTAYFTLSQVERRLGNAARADELQARYDAIMEARRAAAPANP